LAKLSCAARNDTSHWDEIFNIREIRGAERNTLLLDANCGRGYKSLLRCAIERPFRMVTRIEMLSATSILSSASGGIERDLSNESLHFFSVGTRRFSSSNQFSTTLICVGAEASCWFGLSIKKRWPSGETS